MNQLIVLCSIICIAATAYILPEIANSHSAIAQSSVQINHSNNSMTQSSNSEQTTEISLDATQLRSPHMLKISVPNGTTLSGQVSINGRVVKQFDKQGISLNLLPYLSRGRKTIAISGRYSPTQSTVQINFLSPGNQVNQQTGGNGILAQTLVLDVR